MQKIYFVGTNKRNHFHELWQQHKQLKTIEIMIINLNFMTGDVYINSYPDPLTKFSTSSRSTNFKDILPWNMITKTVLISTRIVISCAMKRGLLFSVWKKYNGKWDNNMIRISQWRERHCRTNTNIRNKQIQKSRTESHSQESE